jgi:hypothetical protein
MNNTTTTEELAYTVTISHDGYNTRVLASFSYESDALMFARAFFNDGQNGGNLNVLNGFGGLCAYTHRGEFINVSEGAQTDGFNG